MVAKTLRLWLLWMAFTCCCPLSWLPIWLRSKVVDPCFIYCHIFMQKLFFVALKQLQTILWIIDALLFLIDCEEMRYPLWTQRFHRQMFMQIMNTLPSDIFNSSAISRNFNLIGQNKFVEFFGVFWVNCWIWVTWALRIICICTTAFKVSIPRFSHCFRWSRIQITHQAIALLEQYFFPSESNALSTHEIQIFPLFWKISIVASLR